MSVDKSIAQGAKVKLHHWLLRFVKIVPWSIPAWLYILSATYKFQFKVGFIAGDVVYQISPFIVVQTIVFVYVLERTPNVSAEFKVGVVAANI